MLIHLFTCKYLFWTDTLQEGDVSVGFSKNAILTLAIRMHFGDLFRFFFYVESALASELVVGKTLDIALRPD